MQVLLFVLSVSVVREIKEGSGGMVFCFDLSRRVVMLLKSYGITQRWMHADGVVEG